MRLLLILLLFTPFLVHANDKCESIFGTPIVYQSELRPMTQEQVDIILDAVIEQGHMTVDITKDKYLGLGAEGVAFLNTKTNTVRKVFRYREDFPSAINAFNFISNLDLKIPLRVAKIISKDSENLVLELEYIPGISLETLFLGDYPEALKTRARDMYNESLKAIQDYLQPSTTFGSYINRTSDTLQTLTITKMIGREDSSLLTLRPHNVIAQVRSDGSITLVIIDPYQ